MCKHDWDVKGTKLFDFSTTANRFYYGLPTLAIMTTTIYSFATGDLRASLMTESGIPHPVVFFVGFIDGSIISMLACGILLKLQGYLEKRLAYVDRICLKCNLVELKATKKRAELRVELETQQRQDRIRQDLCNGAILYIRRDRNCGKWPKERLKMKQEKRGKLYLGTLSDAEFLGLRGSFCLAESGNPDFRNPGRGGGPGATVYPPDPTYKDLLLYVNNKLVTERRQLRTGDICEVRQVVEEDTNLEDSRDDFEPADEAELLRTELQLAHQATATMLKTEKKLKAEIRKLEGDAHLLKSSIIKATSQCEKQARLADARLMDLNQAQSKLDAIREKPPLLVNRITGDGPYIDVGGAPDSEGRRFYYRGNDSKTVGNKTQMVFTAYPATLEPQGKRVVYYGKRVALLMITSASIGIALAFLANSL